jgi:ABC-type oligopeptide transport system substrate-binding subunit
MRSRLRRVGVELQERARVDAYREKLENGNFQTYRQGWFADYPDPENFLFLFYGPNSKTKVGGENINN